MLKFPTSFKSILKEVYYYTYLAVVVWYNLHDTVDGMFHIGLTGRISCGKNSKYSERDLNNM